jgi:hypothetical protein
VEPTRATLLLQENPCNQSDFTLLRLRPLAFALVDEPKPELA